MACAMADERGCDRVSSSLRLTWILLQQGTAEATAVPEEERREARGRDIDPPLFSPRPRRDPRFWARSLDPFVRSLQDQAEISTAGKRVVRKCNLRPECIGISMPCIFVLPGVMPDARLPRPGNPCHRLDGWSAGWDCCS